MGVTVTLPREQLKKAVLELLRSDWEFRRAVAAELGLLEILERMDRLEERMARLEERMVKLEERMLRVEERILKVEERLEEHAKAIRALQEQVARLQEQVVKLQEQVAEHTKAIRALQEQVMKHEKAIERLREDLWRLNVRIDALGARWGIVAEITVRDALYKILQEYLGVVRVEKWMHYDRDGFVFGRPAYIEIDIVVKDDVHHLIEVKSNVDVYDVYVFNRKCELYTRIVKPKKFKKLIVTCFIDDRALKTAKELGIEVVRA